MNEPWRRYVFIVVTALLAIILMPSCRTTHETNPDYPELLPRNPDGTVDWEEAERVAREIWEEANPPKVEPTPEPTPAPEPDEPEWDGRYSEEGSQRLLVKPESDNNGNLVVLLPAAWNNSFRDVWIEGTDGRRHDDTGRRNINVNPDGSRPHNSNGNRRHIWFRSPGPDIGTGTLVVTLADGVRRIDRNFADRSEVVER